MVTLFSPSIAATYYINFHSNTIPLCILTTLSPSDLYLRQMGLGFRFTVYFEVPDYCACSHYVGCYAISHSWEEEAFFSQWEKGKSCTSSTLPTPQEGPLLSHCEITHCCQKTLAATGTWTGPWLVAAGFLLQTGLKLYPNYLLPRRLPSWYLWSEKSSSVVMGYRGMDAIT